MLPTQPLCEFSLLRSMHVFFWSNSTIWLFSVLFFIFISSSSHTRSLSRIRKFGEETRKKWMLTQWASEMTMFNVLVIWEENALSPSRFLPSISQSSPSSFQEFRQFPTDFTAGCEAVSDTVDFAPIYAFQGVGTCFSSSHVSGDTRYAAAHTRGSTLPATHVAFGRFFR